MFGEVHGSADVTSDLQWKSRRVIERAMAGDGCFDAVRPAMAKPFEEITGTVPINFHRGAVPSGHSRRRSSPFFADSWNQPAGERRSILRGRRVVDVRS